MARLAISQMTLAHWNKRPSGRNPQTTGSHYLPAAAESTIKRAKEHRELILESQKRKGRKEKVHRIAAQQQHDGARRSCGEWGTVSSPPFAHLDDRRISQRAQLASVPGHFEKGLKLSISATALPCWTALLAESFFPNPSRCCSPWTCPPLGIRKKSSQLASSSIAANSRHN